MRPAGRADAQLQQVDGALVPGVGVHRRTIDGIDHLGGAALQHQLPALISGQIDDDLGPLTRREHQASGRRGTCQQSGIGGDDLESSSVVESEVVDAGVGAVEQTQANVLRRHRDIGLLTPVDQEAIALHTHQVVHAGHVEQRAVGRDAAVLDDHRDVVDSPRMRQPEAAIHTVIDQQEPGQARIGLRTGARVGVGMKPQRRARLVERETDPLRPSRLYRAVRASVGRPRHDGAMPMQGRRLRKPIAHLHAHRLCARNDQRGTEHGAVVTPGRSPQPGNQFAGARLCAQREVQHAVTPVTAQLRRNRKGSLKRPSRKQCGACLRVHHGAHPTQPLRSCGAHEQRWSHHHARSKHQPAAPSIASASPRGQNARAARETRRIPGFDGTTPLGERLGSRRS